MEMGKAAQLSQTTEKDRGVAGIGDGFFTYHDVHNSQTGNANLAFGMEDFFFFRTVPLATAFCHCLFCFLSCTCGLDWHHCCVNVVLVFLHCSSASDHLMIRLAGYNGYRD